MVECSEEGLKTHAYEGAQWPPRTLGTLEERYKHILATSPAQIAVGLQGDSVPTAFQRRGQAQERLQRARRPLRQQYGIVGFGSGAARRFYVVPTFEKWLTINGWVSTPAASGKKAST